MTSFWVELKRRNVVRVAIAYAIVSWLLLQVADVVLDNIEAPAWVFQAILLLLVIGFPVAIIFAWAFELTPEGLKKEKDVDRSESITNITGRKLDFVIIGVLVVAVGFLLLDKIYLSEGDTAADEVIATERQSIAVLPFVNMSPDPDQEYFSDGLSEEILNLLAKIPDLKVIGRTSSFAFKGKNQDLRIIGQTLGVRTLLEGSVRKSGNEVRVTVQLIDASDGTHIWSETYNRTLNDIFAVQDDVAAAIIDALQMHISAIPTRGRPTDNTEAYALFLKARAFVSDGRFDESEETLLSAIELDPKFAEAHELLAYKHWIHSEQQRAYEAAAKALAIDPNLVLAQAVYQQAKIGTHLAGVEAFERAVREQPGNPALIQPLSWNLMQAGYLREALSLSEQLVDVDPLSVFANGMLSGALYAAGHTGESITALERAVHLSGAPGAPWSYGNLHLQEKQDEKAIAHFEDYLRRFDYPDTSWVRELITAGRDPATGQAYLDRRIPEVIASMPEGSNLDPIDELDQWYLIFGFLDRYFELILGSDPNDSRWTDADFYLFDGILNRRLGFTAHPKFLEVAEVMGIINIWEQRGPPDFCDKVGGQWTCK